ncbi:MAG: Glycosyl transferase, group 1 [Firmicutes bacterium]|nr:Glycosyl transferase, group 1 [Bacillota bacterium]
MKIDILSSYFYHAISEIHGYDRIIFGGGERYLIELCKFLQSEGHVVSVYQPISAPAGVDLKSIPLQIQKKYQGIPITCMVGYKSNIYNTCPELNRDFNEIAGYADLAIFFTTFMSWPYAPPRSISICHGIYWDYSHGSYATMTPNDKQEFMRRQIDGFGTTSLCIGVDSNVRRVIQAISPGAEKNIRIIPNFVDTEVFKPAPKTWEGIKVLYPRRLTMLRGSNEFIRASQAHPEYQYLAVGQATHEDTERQAQNWAANLPHLKFIHKEMDGMEEVYQQSDIAVIPTKACEGLSLSLLEAMACGLPIITTPVGGIGDAVIDGYNALVFDPNHDDLAEYIHEMAQNEEMRKIMGQRNREIAQCFDIRIWQARWKQIIDQF